MAPTPGHGLVLVVVAGVLCSSPAMAAGGAATDSYDDVSSDPVSVSILADMYLLYNGNDPASGTNQLRWSDFVADGASVNYVRLTVAHRPEPIGARLDFGAGDTAAAFLADDPGAPRYRGLSRCLSFVEQAFVTWSLPAADQLSIDLGKFSTPVGFEDNETPPNWNYSRSLLFTWGEPTLHTGARLTMQPLGERLAATLFWVNGWNANIAGGDDMRSIGVAVTWHPGEKTDIVAVYLGGLERPPTRLASPILTFRNLVDAYVTHRLSDDLSLALTSDYGHDAAQGGVTWWGVAGCLQARFTSWLTGAGRAEYYADPEGFTTGLSQHLVEVTATIDATAPIQHATLVVRLEYRHDQSDARAFEGRIPDTLHSQDTVTLALVASH